MGLLDIFPCLDDKNFEDLVKEVRSLIPQYAPEWTDHNITDPGITFIELFSWLAEMQIYQLNQITNRNYLKFLRLVGLYPYDAQPARVDIKAQMKDDTIESGTQFLTKVGAEKIVFEIDEDITLIKGSIKSVTTFNDAHTTDNTQANQTDGVYFSAFDEGYKEGAQLQLEFDEPLPEKDFQITFLLFDDDSVVEDRKTQVIPSVDLVWEYFMEKKWIAFNIRKDETLALTRSGRIVYSWPSEARNKNCKKIRCRIKKGLYEIPPLMDSISPDTVTAIQIETIRDEDLGISTGFPDQKVFFKKNPVIRRNLLDRSLFVVSDIIDWSGLLKKLKDPEKQGPGKRIWNLFDQDTQNRIESWREDQIPDSELKNAVVDALNNLLKNRDLYDVQSFRDVRLPEIIENLSDYKTTISEAEVVSLNRFLIKTAYPDKITDGNPIIQVRDKKRDCETWIEVDDLESSGPDDAHYILDPEKGEITFGNGLNGRIPMKDSTIRALIYRTTLGQKGNIPRGQKFWISKEGSEKYFGENLTEAAGGRSAESIEHAKGRARKEFRDTHRAITSEDYEKLACSIPGLKVARARAIPDYDPDYPCIDIPNSITVVAVPEAKTEKPVPGEGFLQTISDYLEARRLLTSNLHVTGPEYVMISVKCKVHIMKKSSPSEVKTRVRDALKEFLDPLKGGPDKKGWPFGRVVYPSEIYQIIDKVEGVDYTTNVTLSGESESGQYLFNWDDIPGTGSERLIEFLKREFGISWVETGKIEKINNDRNIRVTAKKNYLLLSFNNERTKVNLKIDDGRSDELIVKIKNGKLNIYSGRPRKAGDAIVIPPSALVYSGEHEIEIMLSGEQ